MSSSAPGEPRVRLRGIAGRDQRTGGRGGWLPAAVVLAAPIITLTGMQLVLPALPVIQQELGLSDRSISLVSSLYLLPGMLLSIPAGLAGDRFGRTRVFAWSLVVFGLGGIVLLFRYDVPTLFAVRMAQGAAFAAVLPLTITLISDIWRQRGQLEVQGRRVVGMNLANAVWPAVGGMVASVAWHGTFALQGLALPLGLLAFRVLPSDLGRGERDERLIPLSLLKVLRTGASLAVQASGLVRFILRFGFFTYLPILLVGARGFSPAVVGTLLGASAMTGTVAAAVAGRVARRVNPSRILALGAVGASAGVALLAVGGPGSWIGPLVYGVGDGFFTVMHAGFMTEAAPSDQRALFVAVSGAFKNLGKFLGPSLIALLLLVVPLPAAMLVLAGLNLIILPMPRALRGLDRALSPGSTVPID